MKRKEPSENYNKTERKNSTCLPGNNFPMIWRTLWPCLSRPWILKTSFLSIRYRWSDREVAEQVGQLLIIQEDKNGFFFFVVVCWECCYKTLKIWGKANGVHIGERRSRKVGIKWALSTVGPFYIFHALYSAYHYFFFWVKHIITDLLWKTN